MIVGFWCWLFMVCVNVVVGYVDLFNYVLIDVSCIVLVLIILNIDLGC